MRKFMYFLSADAAHMQTRLNRLAQRGLELDSVEGLFTARVRPTERTDLRYLAVPCGRADRFPTPAVCRRYGWELMGGFNGTAILRSLPCVDADEAGLREQLRADGCIHSDRFMVPAMVLVLLAAASALYTAPMWYPGAGGAWYLSYLGIGIPAVCALLLALAAANIVTLHTYPSAWIHGLTVPILLGGFLLLVLLGLLDESGQTAFFVGILLALAVACAVPLWRKSRGLSLVLAGACLLTLCLGLLSPNADRTASGMSLHHEMAQRPVVQLTDLGIEDSLTGSGFRREGTFLVRSTTYWEMTETDSVSSEVYRCLFAGLADQVEARAVRGGGWTQTESGWSRSEGSTVLLRRGNTVAVVSAGETLTGQQLEQIEAALFS